MTEHDHRTRVRRRDFLTGGAGLLVGVGATELGNALIPGQAGLGPDVASAGEELMTEHGVLKRVLLAYRAIGDRLAADTSVPAGVVTDAAQIISDYIESFHEGLEEAYVFPRVNNAQPALVRTLLIQHDRGRHLTASILAVAAAGLRAATARESLRKDVAAFVRMYEPHEAWEDTVIYPTLRHVSSHSTLNLLAERFHDLENTQYGDDALQRILGRVSGVEQQLDIHDLGAFTPSL